MRLRIEESVLPCLRLGYIHPPSLFPVQGGWVGVKGIVLKKKLTAADFYNGYLHSWFQHNSKMLPEDCKFQTLKLAAAKKNLKGLEIRVRSN